MLTKLSHRLSRGKTATYPLFTSCKAFVIVPRISSDYSQSVLPFNGVNSIRHFGSYIENYYTTNHASTGFSSPLRKNVLLMVFIFQAVFTFGYVFHTNYYYTGKSLPKPDGSSQLCSDSK